MTSTMQIAQLVMLLIAAALGYSSGPCIRSDPAGDVAATAATPAPAAPALPVASAAPAPTASPSPPPAALDAEVGEDVPLIEGWATIEERADSDVRAWMEGEIQQGDRLIVTTSNVRRFAMDLTRLRLEWNQRILLKLDKFNFELTKKRWPVIKFVRTASGAWEAAEK